MGIIKICYFIIPLLFFLTPPMMAQTKSQTDSASILRSFSTSVEKGMKKLNAKIARSTLKALNKIQRTEDKLYHSMLEGKDSAQARIHLQESRKMYEDLKNKIKTSTSSIDQKNYIPRLDTISVALQYLGSGEMAGKLKSALTATNLVKDRFQSADEIAQTIRLKMASFKAQLENHGMIRELKNINKQVYYYNTQIKEYKASLSDGNKAQQKALELLGKTKMFQDFMKKHSMLASLFKLPGNDLPTMNIAGLQTTLQVNNLIQRQLSSGGAGALQEFQQQMEQAQAQLEELKKKISSSGGSSNDELPDFKPNAQKTRSFAQRLEFGFNLQLQKAQYYFPNTTDIGLSVGYKLSDKSVIGIGASYKAGFGTGWKNIIFTQQGAGLRSYADWKIKTSWWVSGGFEMNYRSLFNSMEELRNFNAWQQSGLIGLSKKYQVSKKLKGNMQLLWDFLSYRQAPGAQHIIFRVGYNLK